MKDFMILTEANELKNLRLENDMLKIMLEQACKNAFNIYKGMSANPVSYEEYRRGYMKLLKKEVL